MPAYLIGGVDVSDPSWLEEYGPKVEALVEKHGGKYLVRGGKTDVKEGQAPSSRVMVIVEFPSMANAQAWYNDPDYAPLIKLRQTGSSSDLVLVEGL